ncbi:hypothetical protein NXS19_013363 [Fusarium pseudograminearum]|nr:hypothetical protein NXS19_013363 [Fusarium pseudograminearum]
MVPSQSQPDHLQDTLRYSPRPVLRLDEEEEEDERSWDRALRPVASDSPIINRFGHSRDSSAEKIAQTHQPVASPRLHGSHSRSPLVVSLNELSTPRAQPTAIIVKLRSCTATNTREMAAWPRPVPVR